VEELNLNNLKKAHEAELLNIANKLARSSGKYHYYLKSEINSYINNLLDMPNNEFVYRRHATLTQLNQNQLGIIHTGKYTIEKFFSKYHIGLKIGSFTKSRKPYYFRSKKKNVTKKYTI
jgi:hypothetical protein